MGASVDGDDNIVVTVGGLDVLVTFMNVLLGIPVGDIVDGRNVGCLEGCLVGDIVGFGVGHNSSLLPNNTSVTCNKVGISPFCNAVIVPFTAALMPDCKFPLPLHVEHTPTVLAKFTSSCFPFPLSTASSTRNARTWKPPLADVGSCNIS